MGSVSVEDDGRGIPVGIHPEEGVPVVEIVFTRLHAGGKFDKAAGGAYTFSGGLHGVGVSVTNALATRLAVTVWRDGQVSELEFADGGNVSVALHSRAAQRGEKKSGTRVTVWPDARYFDSPTLPLGELQRLLRSKAVLLPGVRVTLRQEKNGEAQSWFYEHGLRGYLVESLNGAEPLIPLFEGERFADGNEDSFAEGEGAAWVVAWTEDGAQVRESYVNLIPTPAGGTHESGLREGLFQAVRGFIELHNLQPKGVKLLPEDVFSRVSFVLSAKVLDPQFQGQIKERLNSRDAVRLVSSFTRPALELWLNHHVEHGKKLAELVIRQAQARTRAGQKIEKKKSSGVAVLPGKLTDCETEDITRNELFLVEGDSAGGSAKMGRDKEFQAILPLRGKVLNTWETERDASSPTTKCTISPWPSVWIRTVRTIRLTCRTCATGRSASSQMLTSMARISRCCCSHCSSGIFRNSSPRATSTLRVRRCIAWMRRPVARSPRRSSTRWTKANSSRFSTSCARTGCARPRGRSAVSRGWAR